MLGLKTAWYRSAQYVRAVPTEPQFDSRLESGNYPPAGGSAAIGRRLAAGKISRRATSSELVPLLAGPDMSSNRRCDPPGSLAIVPGSRATLPLRLSGPASSGTSSLE